MHVGKARLKKLSYFGSTCRLIRAALPFLSCFPAVARLQNAIAEGDTRTHLAASHAYRRRHHHHLQARRPIRRGGARKAQLVLARLAKTARNQDGSAPHRPGLGGAAREPDRKSRSGWSAAIARRKPTPCSAAAVYRRRPFQPAYARPRHGLLHSGRAARSASRHRACACSAAASASIRPPARRSCIWTPAAFACGRA